MRRRRLRPLRKGSGRADHALMVYGIRDGASGLGITKVCVCMGQAQDISWRYRSKLTVHA